MTTLTGLFLLEWTWTAWVNIQIDGGVVTMSISRSPMAIFYVVGNHLDAFEATNHIQLTIVSNIIVSFFGHAANNLNG